MKFFSDFSLTELKKLLADYGFSGIDLHFAAFILRFYELPEADLLFLAAALASYSVRRGDVCCDLTTLCGKDLFTELPKLFPERDEEKISVSESEEQSELVLPPITLMMEYLAGFKSVVSCLPEINSTPLVLDQEGRLYLHRYYSYESDFADMLKLHLNVPPDTESVFSPEISKRFASYDLSGTDWQCFAAELAMHNNFTIITGGPGTGKTTVAAALLALELQKNPESDIRLCAPTGKAQARLQEAVLEELDFLNISEEIKEKIKQFPCSTINHLLKTVYASPNFGFNRENPLPADMVIVDEASMISSSMMAKLFDAVLPNAKLVLLGDKDQLSSVEAGYVLGNLCASGTANLKTPDHLPLTGHIAELTRNYRSQEAPTICSVSAEIRIVEPEGAAALSSKIMALNEPDFKTVLRPEKNKLEDRLKICLGIQIPYGDATLCFSDLPKYMDVPGPESLRKAFRLINGFKILSPLRHGMFGVENLNEILSGLFGMDGSSAGMPVMILQNDPVLKLWNGDIGLVSGEADKKVYFPGDHADFRSFPLEQLPAWEPAFAMTIHKSQGSGFDHVLIILPEKESPLLTVELIYTAITRAKKSVELWASSDILEKALARRIQRKSGLRSILSEKLSRNS